MVRKDKKNASERVSLAPEAPRKAFEALKGAVEGRGCRLIVTEISEEKKEKWEALLKKYKDSGMILE